MTTHISVFYDRREPKSNWTASSKLVREYDLNLNTDEALEGLRKIDWHYPVHVVYREPEDYRWSWLTLGLIRSVLNEE